MNWYFWLNNCYRRIIHFFKNNDKKSHFILLFSLQGNGELSLLYAISRWLMCFSPKGEVSCGICGNCSLMKLNCHPDYYYYDIANSDFVFGVNNARSIINKVHQSSHCGGNKVVCIPYVEHITKSAVNSLLKILEEPPINTYFLFGSQNKNNLLSTIVSRSACFFLLPPDEKLSLFWFRKQKINFNFISISAALRLSNMAPLASVKLINSVDWKIRKSFFKLFYTVIRNNNFFNLLYELYDCNNNGNKKIYWMISLLLDAIKHKYRIKNSFVNIDYMDLIFFLSSNWSLRKLSNRTHNWFIYYMIFNKYKNIDKKIFIIKELLNWEKDG